MLHLIHQITHLRRDIQAELPRESAESRKNTVMQAVLKIASEPETNIPAHLHQAGEQQTRFVSDDTLRNLQRGKFIARTVRQLVGNGAPDQERMLIRTPSMNVVKSQGARELANLEHSTSWYATSTILTGCGKADQQGYVSFEIARSLKIPCELARSNTSAHSYLILYPKSDTPVVVDPWTLFPTSCLLSDSPFYADECMASYDPQVNGASSFDLKAIEMLRERLAQTLGKYAIEEVVGAEMSNKAQLLSDSVKTVMREQGVVLTSQLRMRDPDQQEMVTTELRRTKQKLDKWLLQKYADRRIVTGTVIDEIQNISSTNNAGTLSEQAQAQRNALANAKADLYQAASTQVGTRAATRPAHPPADSGSQDSRITANASGSCGPAHAQGEWKATIRTTSTRWLRNVAMHGPNMLYRTAAGDSYSTTQAPQRLIDTIADNTLLARQRNFPAVFQDRASPPPGPDPQYQDIQRRSRKFLIDACNGLTALASQARSESRLKSELNYLNDILQRLDECSPELREDTLIHLAGRLPHLHEQLRQQAIQSWSDWQQSPGHDQGYPRACEAMRNTWLEQSTNPQLEPMLRKLVLQFTPLHVLAVAIAKSLHTSHLHGVIRLNLLDQILQEARTPAERQALVSSIEPEINRIRDNSQRAAAQAILLD